MQRANSPYRRTALRVRRTLIRDELAEGDAKADDMLLRAGEEEVVVQLYAGDGVRVGPAKVETDAEIDGVAGGEKRVQPAVKKA